MDQENQGAALTLVGCGCVAVIVGVVLLFVCAGLSGPITYLWMGA